MSCGESRDRADKGGAHHITMCLHLQQMRVSYCAGYSPTYF